MGKEIGKMREGYIYSVIICGAGAIMYNDTVKKIYTERAERERERGIEKEGEKERVCSLVRMQSEMSIKEESRRESCIIFSIRSNIVLHGGKYIYEDLRHAFWGYTLTRARKTIRTTFHHGLWCDKALIITHLKSDGKTAKFNSLRTGR